MEKKNTMQLTIIGIATLLVAVVGATYAYFSLNATNSTTAANINAVTESLGTIALTTTTSEMHITTTASDFAKNAQRTYWATETIGTNHVATEETNAIHTIAVTGGSNTAVYECSYTLTVNTTGLPASGMAASGEYIVYIKGTNGTVAHTLDMGTTSNRNKTYTVTTYLTGAGASKTISASAKLINTNGEQNYLQGKTIATTFNVTTNSLNCESVASAGSDSITEVALPVVSYYQNIGSIKDSWNAEHIQSAQNPSWEYYIKQIVPPAGYPMLASSDLYETVDYYDYGASSTIGGFYISRSECLNDEWGDPETDEEYTICEKVASAGDALYDLVEEQVSNGVVVHLSESEIFYNHESCEVRAELLSDDDFTYSCEPLLATTSYEVCGVFENGTVCMPSNIQKNLSTYATQFTNAGATCTYYDSNRHVTNNINNAVFMECAAGNSVDDLRCSIGDNDGTFNSCRVYVGGCFANINNSDAWCDYD